MSERVLVVDDEPGMRSLLTRVIEKEGYTAAACADGEEALETFRREDWDLVIADIRDASFDRFSHLFIVQGFDRGDQPDILWIASGLPDALPDLFEVFFD